MPSDSQTLCPLAPGGALSNKASLASPQGIQRHASGLPWLQANIPSSSLVSTGFIDHPLQMWAIALSFSGICHQLQDLVSERLISSGSKKGSHRELSSVGISCFLMRGFSQLHFVTSIWKGWWGGPGVQSYFQGPGRCELEVSADVR